MVLSGEAMPPASWPSSTSRGERGQTRDRVARRWSGRRWRHRGSPPSNGRMASRTPLARRPRRCRRWPGRWAREQRDELRPAGLLGRDPGQSVLDDPVADVLVAQVAAHPGQVSHRQAAMVGDDRGAAWQRSSTSSATAACLASVGMCLLSCRVPSADDPCWCPAQGRRCVAARPGRRPGRSTPALACPSASPRMRSGRRFRSGPSAGSPRSRQGTPGSPADASLSLAERSVMVAAGSRRMDRGAGAPLPSGGGPGQDGRDIHADAGAHGGRHGQALEVLALGLLGPGAVDGVDQRRPGSRRAARARSSPCRRARG